MGLYLARIGRPDILWDIQRIRLVLSHSGTDCVRQKVERDWVIDNCVQLATQQVNASWACVRTPILLETWQIQRCTAGGMICIVLITILVYQFHGHVRHRR